MTGVKFQTEAEMPSVIGPSRMSACRYQWLEGLQPVKMLSSHTSQVKIHLQHLSVDNNSFPHACLVHSE